LGIFQIDPEFSQFKSLNIHKDGRVSLDGPAAVDAQNVTGDHVGKI
jgi:hypothetical protein